MGGPSIASLKFAFWLVCVTFFLHCFLIPTAVTDVHARTYKEKRGVRLIGLMPLEAYVPSSIAKRYKGQACANRCHFKKCRGFNIDISTGKCELFDTESGGSLVSDPNSSYYGGNSIVPYERCILLIGGAITSDAAPVEYYHPIEGVECNVDIIGNMSTERIREDTKQTSGCYLPSTEQVVIREMNINSKPPMLYGLKDGYANPLPNPYNPIIVSSTAASVGPSKCLSCGGSVGAAIAECFQFDPTSDDTKWTAISPMPYKSYLPSSVSLTIKDFYVVGGYDGRLLNQLYRFDVDGGTWHEQTPMLTWRHTPAAAPLSKTQFIVCGGRSTGGPVSICEIYDSTLNSWTTTGNLSHARQAFAMISFGGEIYALGGYDDFGSGSLDSVEKYNPATGEWEIAKAMKHPRYEFVGVAV